MKRIAIKGLVVLTTLFLVSLFTFSAFAILPGNPAEIMLGTEADPLQVQQLTEELGLHEPLLSRYFSWVSGLFTGDLGTSIRYRVPVQELILGRLPVTVSLACVTLLLTLCIVFPVGIFLALGNGKKSNVIFSGLSQLGVSIPTFWLGSLLILFFAVKLKMLPAGDFVAYNVNPIVWLRSLILPAFSLAIGTSAVVIRYLKTTLLDQSMLDYVRTAKSKGLTDTKVMCRHVLRNALLPTITIFGLVVVDVLGGSIIIENVFNLPGIGTLLTTGVAYRDFPLVQSLVFYLSVLVVVVNTFVDVIYHMVDPRIRMK